MENKIVGKVAEIIDNRTLALNIGSEKGVINGMIFQILDKTGKTIKDPDTGESLGVAQLPKMLVKITHTTSKYSIAETFKYKEINIGGVNNLGAFSNLLSPPKYVKKYETFDIDEAIKEEIDKEKSVIKVGDIAEHVEDALALDQEQDQE